MEQIVDLLYIGRVVRVDHQLELVNGRYVHLLILILPGPHLGEFSCGVVLHDL